MIINELNGPIINTNDIYIHDDILSVVEFDRIHKKLNLFCSKWMNRSSQYSICFINVLGFEMTSADFWGASERILDFEYIKPQNRVVLPRIQKKWEQSSLPLKPSYDQYIETLITFASGDQLRVACESIVL